MHGRAELPTGWTGADLIFEPDGHSYRLPLSGVVVPSVTQVLSAVGVSMDFHGLGAMGERIATAIERKRAIGHALHADAHAYDDHDLDWTTVHPDVLPYLQAWVTFRQNLGFLPIQRERRLYSPALGVCGTLDAVGYRQTDLEHRILVDLKTGDPEDAGARYQTGGYQLLWEAEHPDAPICERWSVQLIPGRQIPYQIHPYTDWTDGATFRAFVATYFAQAARRKGSR